MPALKAIRYTGINLEEVLNFSPQGEITYSGDASELRDLRNKGQEPDIDDLKDVYVVTPTGRRHLPIGEWAVCDENGEYCIVDDSAFQTVNGQMYRG